MKNKLLFAAFFLASFSCLAQRSSMSLTIERKGGTDYLQFTSKAGNAVRYYLVEASRDSLNFEIVGRIDAQHQAPFASRYSYSAYDMSFAYYRIREVDVVAASVYSGSVAVENDGHPFTTSCLTAKY